MLLSTSRDIRRPTAFDILALVICVLSVALMYIPSAEASPANRPAGQTANGLTILGTPYEGSTVSVRGFGYLTGETVSIYFDGAQIGSTQARHVLGIVNSIVGYIQASVTIPEPVSNGSHTFTATGQTSAFSLQSTVTVQGNWYQAGFLAAGGRYNAGESAISVANVSTLALAWKWTDPNLYAMGANAPTVVDGNLYMGTSDGYFRSFAATTGQSRWNVNLQTNFNGQAAADHHVVYTTGYNLSALDSTTGTVLWDTGSMTTIFSWSPALANGVLYVVDGQHLYAFKAAGCGQRRCLPIWTSAPVNDAMSATPTVANGVVYVPSQFGTLYAFDASTGQRLWSAFTSNTNIRSPLVVSNGIVYVGSNDDNLYAFSAAGCGQSTCTPLWKATAGGALNTPLALANGVIYVGSSDHNLYAFSATGCGAAACSFLWTGPTNDQMVSGPAVANGVVYIGSNDGSLYAFNAAGCNSEACAPLWSYATGGAIWSAPVVVDGYLYFTSRDNALYAFHLPSTAYPVPLPNGRLRLVKARQK